MGTSFLHKRPPVIHDFLHSLLQNIQKLKIFPIVNGSVLIYKVQIPADQLTEHSGGRTFCQALCPDSCV